MKRTARDRRRNRQTKEARHERERAERRAALTMASDLSGGGPIFGSQPAEVSAVGSVLNPGDPGWQPHPDFLAAHPGWWADDSGLWHPPTDERN